VITRPDPSLSQMKVALEYVGIPVTLGEALINIREALRHDKDIALMRHEMLIVRNILAVLCDEQGKGKVIRKPGNEKTKL